MLIMLVLDARLAGDIMIAMHSELKCIGVRCDGDIRLCVCGKCWAKVMRLKPGGRPQKLQQGADVFSQNSCALRTFCYGILCIRLLIRLSAWRHEVEYGCCHAGVAIAVTTDWTPNHFNCRSVTGFA